MTTYTGSIWRVNYGEIAERNQFRVGRLEFEYYDAYFPISQLSDLVTVLGNAAALSVGQTYSGTYVKALKVNNGFSNYIVVSPVVAGASEIIRFPQSELSDLQSVLNLFVNDSKKFVDDWDITKPGQYFIAIGEKGIANGVATLDGGSKLQESQVPFRLTEAQLNATISSGVSAASGLSAIPVSNWTTRTSAADNQWRSIAWSPALGLFAAVANSGTGNRVMTSLNLRVS